MVNGLFPSVRRGPPSTALHYTVVRATLGLAPRGSVSRDRTVPVNAAPRIASALPPLDLRQCRGEASFKLAPVSDKGGRGGEKEE